MTKAVRIENADTSEYEVVVEVWDQNGLDPVNGGSGSERMFETIILTHPTSLQQFHIWEGRYLKVYERPKAKA